MVEVSISHLVASAGCHRSWTGPCASPGLLLLWIDKGFLALRAKSIGCKLDCRTVMAQPCTRRPRSRLRHDRRPLVRAIALGAGRDRAAGSPCAFMALASDFAASIVKYGGSMLWAAMVFPTREPCSRSCRDQDCAAALVVAVLVELIRLVHTPSLDSFASHSPARCCSDGSFRCGTSWRMRSGLCSGVSVDCVVSPAPPLEP